MRYGLDFLVPHSRTGLFTHHLIVSGRPRSPTSTTGDLEDAGKAYYEYRAKQMLERNEGLTDVYNHFHDPEEISPEIVRLREFARCHGLRRSRCLRLD